MFTAREWLDLLRWVHQHIEGTINSGVKADAVAQDTETKVQESAELEERKVVLAEPIQKTYERVMEIEAGLELERHWLAIEGHPKGSRIEW